MLRQAHYIKPAQATSIPRHHCILDVETATVPGVAARSEHWRLAVCEYFTGDKRRGWGASTVVPYAKPFELWVDLDGRGKDRSRLCVWSHNLSFDLRASAALSFLPRLGWEIEGLSLDGMGGWARFQRGDQSILFCDLLSFLPRRLDEIAVAVELRASSRPHKDAPNESWLDRCKNDVRITGEAVRRVLDMIEADDLGPWRPTGAGQSHSTWRRRFLGARPLVHDRLDVLDAERRASWTGRCEAWRWGKLRDGPYVEHDLSLAYCQIASDCELPSVLVGELRHPDPSVILADSDRLATLAHVQVNTRQPVLPAERDGAIIWPAGQFDTWVWEPELALAVEHADRVEILQAFQYRKAPVLKPFADWIIDQLALTEASGDRLRSIVMKHWARAAVGRCALRYRSWEDWGETDSEDLALGGYLDWDTKQETEMLQVGRKLSVLSELHESPDSLPQIPGWIMSECRRRLWAMMLAAGLRNIVYLDTDCVIVNAAGDELLSAWAARPDAWPSHVKGRYGRIDIDGPRMLDVDGHRRRSGIPLGARRDRSGLLHGQVFMSLRESLSRGTPDSVQIIDRTYAPGGLDRRREHLNGGDTRAFTLTTQAD